MEEMFTDYRDLVIADAVQELVACEAALTQAQMDVRWYRELWRAALDEWHQDVIQLRRTEQRLRQIGGLEPWSEVM